MKLRFKNLKSCAKKKAKGKADEKSEVYRKVKVKYKNNSDAAGGKRRWTEKLGCG